MLHRRAVSLVVLAALAACTPRAGPAAETAADRMLEDIDSPPAEAAMSSGALPVCSAFVMPSDILRGPANFKVEAAAYGTDCARAVVTLALRDESGDAVYTFAGTADKLLGFETVTDQASLATALTDWSVEVADGGMTTTAELPEWKTGADYPIMGDFPFYIEGDLTREQYEALRAEARPMYCHVQGRESLACLDLTDPFANKIGVQALPG